jgi:AcrR family transcriptional regulator
MPAAGSEDTSGRYRQRRRTRAAIVAAATQLLQSGANPSMADIAEAADVSRRTVYLYFPTLEQLLTDATIGALSSTEAVSAAIEAADAGDDPTARVVNMINTMAEQAAETLPLGRSLIKLTVDAAPPEPGVPRRGYRRIGWIEQATAPLRDRLTADEYEQLVSGLAMVVGWEAMIVLADVRGLDAEQRRETTLWAARALIESALANASHSRR